MPRTAGVDGVHLSSVNLVKKGLQYYQELSSNMLVALIIALAVAAAHVILLAIMQSKTASCRR